MRNSQETVLEEEIKIQQRVGNRLSEGKDRVLDRASDSPLSERYHVRFPDFSGRLY